MVYYTSYVKGNTRDAKFHVILVQQEGSTNYLQERMYMISKATQALVYH